MHPYVELAVEAIKEYVQNGKTIPTPKKLPAGMQERAGIFVSLKKHGQLRGCIGTFLPTTANIYEEIVRNAIAAASEDPRFHPVTPDEIEDIVYSVDVLSEPQKVNTVDELNPKKYGVIVTKGFRKGLLLPDLEGVNTVEEQMRITKMKAGINPHDPDIEIYKFTVERYK